MRVGGLVDALCNYTPPHTHIQHTDIGIISDDVV